MRVVISQKHFSLNEKLAKESNKLARSFNNNYSKIENVEYLLLRHDLSVEKKKGILIKKLHNIIIKSFSIDKKKFDKKSFDSLKKRLHIIRKIIMKLRSINYYLETTFLDELKMSVTKIGKGNLGLNRQNDFARDELELLEYTTYKLMMEVVMLDKRLVKGYANKEKNIIKREKADVNDLMSALKKESNILEHMEAKLPPPKAISTALIKEPTFTHWIARIFALLSYLEHTYAKETVVFGKLKKNKTARIKISKKIAHIIKEKSKLIKIMEEKAVSMKKFRINNELKKELHNLTTAINL